MSSGCHRRRWLRIFFQVVLAFDFIHNCGQLTKHLGPNLDGPPKVFNANQHVIRPSLKIVWGQALCAFASVFVLDLNLLMRETNSKMFFD